MPLLEALIGPIAAIIDKVIPDKAQRDKAKLELLQLQGSQDLAEINARLSAIVAEANSHDPWTSRARPSSCVAARSSTGSGWAAAVSGKIAWCTSITLPRCTPNSRRSTPWQRHEWNPATSDASCVPSRCSRAVGGHWQFGKVSRVCR